MLTIISQMAALFILILVGYGAAKLKIIDGRFSQQLSVFVINISSPCLIVSSVMGDISPDNAGQGTDSAGAGHRLRDIRILRGGGDAPFPHHHQEQGYAGHIWIHADIRQCRLHRLPDSRLDFRQVRHLLCEPAEHPVHSPGLFSREKDDTGRLRRAEAGLENPREPRNDSLLPVHADSGVRHQGPAESGDHADNPAREHHSPCSPADNRHIHGPDGPAADFLRKAGLGHICPPPAGSADSHLLFHPPHRLQRRHSRHQHRPRGNACGHIRGDVLPPVRQGRDRHGPGNPHLHPAVDTKHSSDYADTVTCKTSTTVQKSIQKAEKFRNFPLAILRKNSHIPCMCHRYESAYHSSIKLWRPPAPNSPMKACTY